MPKPPSPKVSMSVCSQWAEVSQAQCSRGFTLIEVMITVAIIAILAAIAYPSYQGYVLQARRIQAQSELIDLQLQVEKYRANHPSYADCVSNGRCNLPDNEYYLFAIANTSATAYSLSATAKDGSPQVSDTGCTSLSLDQSGGKLPVSCWKK